MVGVSSRKRGLLSQADIGWDPDTPEYSLYDPGQLLGFSES